MRHFWKPHLKHKGTHPKQLFIASFCWQLSANYNQFCFSRSTRPELTKLAIYINLLPIGLSYLYAGAAIQPVGVKLFYLTIGKWVRSGRERNRVVGNFHLEFFVRITFPFPWSPWPTSYLEMKEDYDPEVTRKHKALLSDPTYDPDIHFPKLVIMTKTSTWRSGYVTQQKYDFCPRDV